MAPTRETNRCELACMTPCRLLKGGEEAAELSLELLWIDDDAANNGVCGNRGKRLTSASFIGEHPVLAVKRKLYEFRRIRRGHKRYLSSSGGNKSPRIGLLNPVLPDAVLCGEAGLRSSAELLVIPRPPSQPSAAIPSLHSLLEFPVEEQDDQWILVAEEDEQTVVEPDGTEMEEDCKKTAEHLPADNPIVVEPLPQQPPKMYQDFPGEIVPSCECRLVPAKREFLPEAHFSRISTGAAELKYLLRVTNENAMREWKTLTLQKRLLQASGYVQPTHMSGLPTNFQLQKRWRGMNDARLSVHLMEVCSRLVTAVVTKCSKPGRDALDALYSICEQYMPLIGDIRALSYSFQLLGEVSTILDDRPAIINTRELTEVPDDEQESEVVQETPCKTEPEQLCQSTANDIPKGGKAAGKTSEVKKKDGRKAKAREGGNPVKKSASGSSVKNTGKGGPLRAGKASKKTKAPKQKASKTQGDKNPSKAKGKVVKLGSKKAKSTASKKSSKVNAADKETLSRPKVSERVKGNFVEQGMPTAKEVTECQAGQLLPARNGTENEVKVTSGQDTTSAKCVSRDELARNNIVESPKTLFPAALSKSSSQPMCAQSTSCSMEVMSIKPYGSFIYDALVSLPSKTLDRSVRSKVGELIRGSASLCESKRSDKRPARSSTFPCSASTRGSAAVPRLNKRILTTPCT